MAAGPKGSTHALARFYDRYFKKWPRQERSRSVVESVLLAALDKVSTGDGEPITLQDIAARAGVGIGSVYDYFRNRDGVLAAVVAKVTEDNLTRFEKVLASVEDVPLEDAIRAIVDFGYATYLAEPRVPRSVLRLAHAMGLMPMLVTSQGLFARTLAQALRRRSDVHVADVEGAAYVATQALWGIVHAMVWEDEPALPREQVRAASIALLTSYLSGASAAR
jgi:AcrR family transcriptional regulator